MIYSHFNKIFSSHTLSRKILIFSVHRASLRAVPWRLSPRNRSNLLGNFEQNPISLINFGNGRRKNKFFNLVEEEVLRAAEDLFLSNLLSFILVFEATAPRAHRQTLLMPVHLHWLSNDNWGKPNGNFARHLVCSRLIWHFRALHFLVIGQRNFVI